MSKDLESWVRLDDHWLRKGKVRRAGIYGRALWLAGLLYAHSEDTDGDLEADVLDVIATEAGMTKDQAQDAADKLLEHGLWERTADGWHIHDYDRYQDTKAEREAKREQGRERWRRWNEAHQNQRVSSPLANAQLTAIKEKEKRDKTPLPPTGGEFDAFWENYPRKVGKDAARRAWAAAVKRAEPADIEAGLKRAKLRWRRDGTETQFIPYPSTWLNAGRWEDEDPAPASAPQDEWGSLRRTRSHP